MKIKKQTGLLYLYEAIICFRMIDVVWVLFLLERGYSLAQVGIAEGVYHVTSMIFEVPSGMVADLFGRKRTLIFSGLAGMGSGIFMALDGWDGWIYLGMIFSALSLNLASGTEEAITYDSLLAAGRAEEYKRVRSAMSVIGRISSALSCTLSPLAIALGYRYTYLVTVLLNLCGVFAVMGLQEPIVTKAQQMRRTVGLGEIGGRLRRHVRDTAFFMRAHPRVLCKLLANAAIGCPCYLIMMYLQEHLVNCGWPKSWIGIPMLLIPLAEAAGAWAAGKSRMKLFGAVVLCGILSGAGTCLTGSRIIAAILLGACIMRCSEGFAEILISENVNREFPSDQRATLISVDSMLYSVLMVVASPLTGFLGSRYSVVTIFYVLGGALLASTVIGGAVVMVKRRDNA